MCGCERGRYIKRVGEREKMIETEVEREIERERMCVCVRVCIFRPVNVCWAPHSLVEISFCLACFTCVFNYFCTKLRGYCFWYNLDIFTSIQY